MKLTTLQENETEILAGGSRGYSKKAKPSPSKLTKVWPKQNSVSTEPTQVNHSDGLFPPISLTTGNIVVAPDNTGNVIGGNGILIDGGFTGGYISGFSFA